MELNAVLTGKLLDPPLPKVPVLKAVPEDTVPEPGLPGVPLGFPGAPPVADTAGPKEDVPPEALVLPPPPIDTETGAETGT